MREQVAGGGETSHPVRTVGVGRGRQTCLMEGTLLVYGAHIGQQPQIPPPPQGPWKG